MIGDYDFIFNSLDDEEEGERYSCVTHKYKREYLGKRCRRISSFAPCNFEFEDGAVWSMYINQLTTLDGEPVAQGVIPAYKASKHIEQTPIRCVETGEVYINAREASLTVGVKSHNILTACDLGSRLKGYHWERAYEQQLD